MIYFLGGDRSQVLNDSPFGDQETASSYQETAAEKELAEFVSVVLADTEVVWEEQFRRKCKTYQHPKLVLYSRGGGENRPAEYPAQPLGRFIARLIISSILT